MDNEETVAGREEDWQERLDEVVRQRDEALARAEQAERESFLLTRGVSADDLDYYVFKIAKQAGDGDFRAAAEAYLRERPLRTDPPARVDTAVPLMGGGRVPSPNETMNALIRGARK